MIAELMFALTTHTVKGDWQDYHPAVRWEFGNNVVTSVFLNSEDNLSLSLGVYGRKELTKDINLFGEAVLATGYDSFVVVPQVRGGFEFYDRTRLWAGPMVNYEREIGAVIGVDFIGARW